jgi:uncharacterized membrane protein
MRIPPAIDNDADARGDAWPLRLEMHRYKYHMLKKNHAACHRMTQAVVFVIINKVDEFVNLHVIQLALLALICILESSVRCPRVIAHQLGALVVAIYIFFICSSSVCIREA